MASADPILLGGGIAKGAPFSVGALQLVQSTTPGSIADSIIVQRLAPNPATGPTTVVTVGTDQYPAATEKLKIIGGLITDIVGGNGSILIGQAASVMASGNGRNIVIGYNAVMNVSSGGVANNSADNILIGPNATLTWGVGGSVMIGAGASVTTAAPVVGAGVVLIGYNTHISTPTGGIAIGLNAQSYGQCVIIGYNAQVSGAFDQSVAIGTTARCDGIDSIALGDTARAAFQKSIALGRGAITTKANQIVIGSVNIPIAEVLIGTGDTAVGGKAVLHRHTNASGLNNPAANIQFQAGLGTGNAATLGRIQFLTGIPRASSDSTMQLAQVVFEVLPTTGAAASPVVSFPVFTTGGAAAAGTLGNAPSAGNPADWIPVLCNGNVRYIPAWA